MTPAIYLEKTSLATKPGELDWLAISLWRQIDNGDIAEAAGPALDEAIRARREELFPRSRSTAKPISAFVDEMQESDDDPAVQTHTCDRMQFPERKHVASPDRAKSRLRKRKWAVSRMMPDWMAERFTEAPRAIGGVIALQYVLHGKCTLSVAEIAALAGASRSTYHNYKEGAVTACDIEIIDRPTRFGLNDTNIIRIRNKRWRQYLDRRKKMAGIQGCNKSDNRLTPTKKEVLTANFPHVDNCGEGGFAPADPSDCREAYCGATP